jgi:type IV pilus assembly protein PilQ
MTGRHEFRIRSQPHRAAAGLAAAAFAVTLLVAGVPAAHAQSNTIEAISGTQQGSSTVLRIRMKSPPKDAPASFSVNNPPRLAFDFGDTDSRVGQALIEMAQGEVRSANVVQSNGRARVVLNLRRPVTHQTVVQGSDLVVTLDPVVVPAAVAPSAAAYTFAKGDATAAHSLRDIDFRRGKDGEGRVVIELSDAQTGVDIRQQGQSIIVDFLGAQLPENLRRRLDVADFGTPVRSVRAIQQGANARLVIEPSGLWEHNAYQSDRQFVVEVKPIREDANRLSQGGRTGVGYSGDKLSLNFQNVDVRALLQVVADFTNLNIVTSDSVAGSLTLRLKDVPWDQALDIILQAKGLDMRRTGNVILVAPREELATKEKVDLESRQQISDIEPLRTETFQLNYQKAEVLGKLLSDDKQRVLSKRGSAVVDARTNKLFVQDTAARLDDVRKMIAQVDVAVRQVLIEARIVEADDRFSFNLGAKLGYNDLRSTIYRTGSQIDPVSGQPVAVNVPVYGAGNPTLGAYSTISGNLSGAADLSSQTGSPLSGINLPGLGRPTPIANTNFVNLPAAGIAGVQAASFAISLFNSALTRFVNLEISALEADQRGKVVSSPRVLTSDQGKAVIEQGTELPYQTATSSGATAIQFRKANLRLEVTPQITPEGNVILDVSVNRDAVGQLTPAGFAIDTRHVKTQVLVENGGTVVIGGIYEQFERNRVNKVPLLGDVPILGHLFKNTTRTNDRTELLVFLTPRVVTDSAAAR